MNDQGRLMMKETNYWQQFLTTGKVEDYLCYRAQMEREEQEEGSALLNGNASFLDSSRHSVEGRKNGQEGTKDAGLRTGDRNRIEGRFHWGV